jgi:phosphotransferase system HPr-like phosphotransfer protein
MLMAMSLPFGAPITMIMDGEDEKEAAAQIQAFLEETL